MFIIPCRYESSRPIINDCVASVNNNFPDEKIVIVNAKTSESNSYADNLDVFDFIQRESDTYETGAYITAFDKYPNEEKYFCIHDSLIIHKPFDVTDLKIVQHFYWTRDNEYLHRVPTTIKLIEDMLGFPIPSQYYGCFGNIVLCDNKTLKYLVDHLRNFIPTNKYESARNELIIGLILLKMGYDLTKHSIQGIHTVIDGVYDNTYVEKRWLKRQ